MSKILKPIISLGSSEADSIQIETNICSAKAKRNIDKTITVDTKLKDDDNQKSKEEIKSFNDFIKNASKIDLLIIIYVATIFFSYICKFKLALYAQYTGITCILLYLVVKSHSNEQIIKNHAAEHMVINAYEDLGRVPDIDEIARYSRFSPECGCRFFGIYFTLYVVNLFLECRFPIITLTIIFSLYKPFKYLGYFVQYFVTKVPDRENLELAYEAMKECIKVSNAPYDIIKKYINITDDNNISETKSTTNDINNN